MRWTPRLVEYLQFYKDDPRGRNIMRGWLTAQGRYRDLILARLQAAGLPLDLMYVAMIESSFDPGEASHAGAAGLWQFMPAGGRIYGLAQTHWVDERRDPLRATVAVVDYWKDLYQRFGDWHLAMAAFNAGYGAVLRSIARYNTNDYWQLCQYENALAWETSLYVPKALAVAIVGHNLELFGFSNLKSDAPEAWEEVAVPGALAVGVIARAAGTTADRIKRLNPHLRRSRTPPDAKSYVVRVPRGAKPGFAKRLADLQTEWDGFDAYVVAYGERFEDVAATFGLSKRRLRELNELSDDSEVGGGSVLVVPRVSAEQRAKNRAAARVALHESGVDQQPGEPLIVALPDRDARLPDTRRVFYRVVIGDTLTAVARAFSVPAAELARWNGLTVEAGLRTFTLYLGGTAILVGLLVTVWVTLALRPLRRLRDAARRIAAGDYQSRIAEQGPTEVADLAREFNVMGRAVEERERERVRSERLAAVDKMASMMAHEVRNPLSAIGLNVELIDEELGQLAATDEGVIEARSLCKSTLHQIHRLNSLTEDYLTLARLPKPVLERKALAPILRAVADFVREDLSKRKVTLAVEITDEHAVAKVDGEQLWQCLLNLLRNAAEAVAQKGGGKVVLRNRRAADRVVIDVADDGPGIEPEVLPRIFDPFFSTKKHGSGLGLALTQEIVREHGGEITVQAELRRGATFSISLPAQPERGEQGADPGESGSHSPGLDAPAPRAPAPEDVVID